MMGVGEEFTVWLSLKKVVGINVCISVGMSEGMSDGVSIGV
jgi:hypothetical protein